jgi:hypothetical protein
MKKITLAIITSFVLAVSANAQYIDLINLGSTGIGALITQGSSWSQTGTATSTSGAVGQGDNFYNTGSFASQNWSSSQGLWIKSSVTTAASPSMSFTFRLFDSSSDIIATYQGDTSDFVSDSGFSYLDLTPVGTPTLTGIQYMQFTFDTASGTTAPNISLQSIATVPEPSTYALMALSGLVLFFIARRRKAQA